MPEGGGVAIAVALAAAIAYYGGQAAWKHAIKPAGCAVVKAATVGHKHCAPKAKKSAQSTQSTVSK